MARSEIFSQKVNIFYLFNYLVKFYTIKFILIFLSKTFIWITWGFTFASFVLGGLSWWVPTFVQYGIQSNNEVPDQYVLNSIKS